MLKTVLASIVVGVSLVAFPYAEPATIREIEDVRVAPMLETEWDQDYSLGERCFNYYTPGGGYCGCVSTAIAQMMYYHQFPRDAVASLTRTCTVDGVKTSLTMKGGVYNWAAMPVKMPTVYRDALSETSREAVGRLVYDVSVSLSTTYGTQYGSAANAGAAIHALPSVFGYASCHSIFFAKSRNFEYTLERFKQLVLPNLDAHQPVVLSIAGSDGGHAIVADGYGYDGGDLCVHCNFGFSGSGNGWYKVPNFSAIGYSFTSCNGVVYNVSPDKSGSIASGRVLDQDGRPVAGATVRIKRGDDLYTTAVTDAKGIYYFHGIPGVYKAEVSNSSLTASRTIVLTQCIDSFFNADGSYIMPYQYVDGGNAAEQDLVLGTTVAEPASEWRTGALSWIEQSDHSVDGTAWRSAVIPYGDTTGEESWLVTEVRGPGKVSFKYTVFPYMAVFSVTLDGTNTLMATDARSAYSYNNWEDEWTSAEFDVPAGAHELRFSYKLTAVNYVSGTFRGVYMDCFTNTYEREIYSTTPVPVPSAWFRKYYPDFAAMFTSVEMLDMVAFMDMDGDGLYDWQEYALNTNPTNVDALAITGIAVRNGVPELTVYPETGNPDYPRVIQGKSELSEGWSAVDYVNHRFFRLFVDIPDFVAP